MNVGLQHPIGQNKVTSPSLIPVPVPLLLPLTLTILPWAAHQTIITHTLPHSIHHHHHHNHHRALNIFHTLAIVSIAQQTPPLPTPQHSLTLLLAAKLTLLSLTLHLMSHPLTLCHIFPPILRVPISVPPAPPNLLPILRHMLWNRPTPTTHITRLPISLPHLSSIQLGTEHPPMELSCHIQESYAH